jgi:uncharacterized protein (TIGR03435 family)
MKRLLALAALFTTVAVAGAQDPAPLAYVASVKRYDASATRGPGGQIRIRPGNISVSGVPLRLLIRQAFGQQGLLQDFQLVGGPTWVNSERFDIELKLEDQAAAEALGPQFVSTVLRQLLVDRFKVKVHTETREAPIFALVLARADGRLGPDLKPSSSECVALMTAGGRGRGGPGRDGPFDGAPGRRGAAPPDGRGGPPPDGRGGPVVGRGGPGFSFDGPVPCGMRGGGFGRFRAGGTTMAQFASAISGNVQRIVTDKTGLTGYYDITITYTPTPDQMPQGPPPPGVELPPIDPNGPSLFTAIQEQLGLKLENQRGPVDVVVIDSIEQPAEN